MEACEFYITGSTYNVIKLDRNFYHGTMEIVFAGGIKRFGLGCRYKLRSGYTCLFLKDSYGKYWLSSIPYAREQLGANDLFIGRMEVKRDGQSLFVVNYEGTCYNSLSQVAYLSYDVIHETDDPELRRFLRSKFSE